MKRIMYMEKYKISTRINGFLKSEIVEARNEDEALDIAWSKWDVDDVYVSKVPDSIEERLASAQERNKELNADSNDSQTKTEKELV